MRNIKYKFLWLTATMALWGACVDDYRDYNPPHPLDAPTLRVSASGGNQALLTVPTNQYQSTFEAYVGLGTPVQFTVSVIDAPGKVGSVSVEPTVPEFGTVTLDNASVAALKGKEQGDFKFIYTPNPDLEAGDDRPLNLVVTVTDSQEENAQTTILTIPTVVGSPCFSQALEPGNYLVTEASGNIDGGEAYTLPAMQDSLDSRIVVSIAEERPGVYTIDEVTGGVWPAYYADQGSSEIQVNVCENNITARDGAASVDGNTFTVNGTVNDDGTVTIEWSYVRDDGTPVDPAKGGYTLTLIKL